MGPLIPVMAGLGLLSGAITGFGQANEAKRRAKQQRDAQLKAIQMNEQNIEKSNQRTGGLASSFLARAGAINDKESWIRGAESYDRLIASNQESTDRLKAQNAALQAGLEPEVSGSFLSTNMLSQAFSGLMGGASIGMGLDELYRTPVKP